MFVKNGRLIIKEEDIYKDIEIFQNYLREAVSRNKDLNYQDIGIEIIYDDECFNEDNGFIWREIAIKITNFNKVIDGYDGDKMWAFTVITYVTDDYEPTLVFQNNRPEFYFSFDLCSTGVTDIFSWENERINGIETVEEYIVNNYINVLEI